MQKTQTYAMALVPLIGDMRSRVKFENNEKTKLGAGSVDNYVEYLTTWGKFRQRGGVRTESGFEQVIETSYQLWVRWQESMELGINNKTKVIIENRFFAINSFEKVGQKRFYLYLTLNETKG